MCLGGHLAFRCAFDKRIRAAVCYFATDIHSQTLGHGKNDDSIKRVKDINGELIMVRSPKKKKKLPTHQQTTDTSSFHLLDLRQERHPRPARGPRSHPQDTA
jgi:dienelactone hydrolase